MKYSAKKILWAFFAVFFHFAVSAQVASDSLPIRDTASGKASAVSVPVPAASVASGPAPLVKLEFVKYKTEHGTDSTFFNLLRITNNNGTDIEGVLRFSVPAGWSLISENERILKVNVGQTIILPVRVSLARNSPGGVSYVISATLSSDRSLFSNKNQKSVSSSCYITIPRKTNWSVYPSVRTIYFNQFAEYANLELRVSNKGNGYQPIKIEMATGTLLEMYGALAGKFYTSVQLKPHQDTLLVFPIKKVRANDQDINYSRSERMMIRIKSQSDSTFRYSTVYFKSLESHYFNELGDRYSPLVVEMQVQNLLSIYNPHIYLTAYGNLILKNQHEMDYYYRLPASLLYNDVAPNTLNNAIWERSRMRFAYRAERWRVMAGDGSVAGISVLGGGGRGLSGSYDINNSHRVGGGFSSAVVGAFISGGLYHESRLKNLIDINSGVNFTQDNYNRISNYALYSMVGFAPTIGHRVSVLLAGSQMNHLYDNQTFADGLGNYVVTMDPGKTFYGFSTRVQHAFKNQKLHTDFNAMYVSKYFSQYNNNRFDLNGRGTYTINTKYTLTGDFMVNWNDPIHYYQGMLYPQLKLMTGRYRLEAANKVNRRLSFFAGPVLDQANYESLRALQSGDTTIYRLKTSSPQLSLRMNYKGRLSSSVNPYFIPGYTFIYSQIDSVNKGTDSVLSREFFRARAGVNIIQKYWGVNVSYDYGPIDEYGLVDFAFFRSYGRTLRIAPYFERYFLNNKMLFSSRNTYSFSMPANSERLNVNGRFSFFPDRSWTFYFDNNIFSYSQINSDGLRTFSRRFYVGFGVKKIFDIPQPGIKYYDVKVVCFRDINGNKIKDESELGLPDIAITLSRESKKDSAARKTISKLKSGKFSPAELVTNAAGEAFYYNLLSGETVIDVVPMNNLKDLHNLNGQKQKANVTSDTTIYVPFAQTYRVIGNIILNRDPYSVLGTLSSASIRVVAIDSAGVSFPALSASDGSYTIYVPQAGEYTVRANNIFGDKLELQESEHIVSFDGAKEFKVDFIFNEKKRQMNINAAGNTITPAGSGTVTLSGIGTSTSAITSGAGNNGGTPLIIAGRDTLKDARIVTDPANTGGSGQPKSQDSSIPVGPGISYRIQLTSRTNKIPPSQYAAKFRNLPGISEYSESGVYKYTSGDLKTIEEAKVFKATVRSKGFSDAFIVPFYKGTRVKY